MSQKLLPKCRQPFLKKKWLTIFGQKDKILYISNHMILFKFHQHVVQVLINVWSDSRLPMSASVLMPDRKINFAVNFPLKLLHATVANAGTRSLKSLHTLFDTYLGHMPVEIWTNRMDLKVQNFEPFEKKKQKQKQKQKQKTSIYKPF